MDELILIKKCQNNNRRAMERMYHMIGENVFRICLRYMGTRFDAEDMLQESIIKIYSSIGKFKWQGPGSFRAWYSKVTVNECLQKLRKKDILQDGIPIENVDGLFTEPEEKEIERIPAKVLQKMLCEMPDGYRTVFNLYVFEKKSHKEIAGILGINEKTSSSQFFRARKFLCGKIEEYFKKSDSQ
ncbi:MAG: sigma-70 family RNA polymerase sigma factor [Bacteroidales bacterium]|nr:sigma-70 family RNA polymerase sigma factor [Bacteroidales bacterium]